MSENCPRCGRPCPYAIQNGQCIQCHDATYLASIAAEDAERGEWEEAINLFLFITSPR